MDTGKIIRTLLIVGICLTLTLPLIAQTPEEAIGFWKTQHEKEGFTTSIMAVYVHNGELYGRIIVSFDEETGELLETHEKPSQRVGSLPHRPKLLEVDLFWNLERDTTKWRGGKIVDPRSGKTYTCDCWVKEGKLILRGRIGPFGVNSVFYAATSKDFPPGYTPPNLSAIIPHSPLSTD